jgi:hypothetical protein
MVYEMHLLLACALNQDRTPDPPFDTAPVQSPVQEKQFSVQDGIIYDALSQVRYSGGPTVPHWFHSRSIVSDRFEVHDTRSVPVMECEGKILYMGWLQTWKLITAMDPCATLQMYNPQC